MMFLLCDYDFFYAHIVSRQIFEFMYAVYESWSKMSDWETHKETIHNDTNDSKKPCHIDDYLRVNL